MSTPTPPNETRPLEITTDQTRIDYITTKWDKYTLQVEKIKNWVEQYLENRGRVLDACAGKTKIDHEPLVRNDVSKEHKQDTNINVQEISTAFPDEHFDAIVYDPPFGPEQAKEYPAASYPGYGKDIKRELDRVLKPSGIVIQLGWTGMGMPPSTYERIGVGIINTLGNRRDYLGLVDQKTANSHCDPTDSWDSYDETPPQSITLNAGDGTRTDFGSTHTIDISTTYPDSNTIKDGLFTNNTITEFLTSHAQGRVLIPIRDGTTDAVESQFTDIVELEGQVGQSTTLSGFTNYNESLQRIPVIELAENLTNVFDTIIYAPPESYFSKCLFNNDGENLGKVETKAKNAFDKILRPGGKVIQVGHNTTNMAGDTGYIRDAVQLVAPVNEANFKAGDGIRYTPTATYITVDTKPGENSSRLSTGKEPCIHCGKLFPTAPEAVMESCPTCGTVHDSCCVDREAEQHLHHHGKPVYHDARWERYQEINNEIHNGHCEKSPDGTHTLSPGYITLPGSGLRSYAYKYSNVIK